MNRMSSAAEDVAANDLGDTPAAWRVVAAASLGLCLSFGAIVPYTFGIFLVPLSREFGWTPVEIPFAFTIVSLTALLTMPLYGRLFDRHGARRVISICTPLFGCGLAALAFVGNQLWHLYLLFFLLGLVAIGSSSIGYSSIVSQWFDRRRGTALGVTMAGLGAGSFIFPWLVARVIDGYGWRAAYLLCAACVLLIATPVILFALKPPRASSTGAPLPVPHTTSEEAADDPARDPMRGVSVGVAVRGGSFWIMLAAFFLISVSANTGLAHLSNLLVNRGVTPTVAALAVSFLGGASFAGRLATGFLVDRFHARYVAAFCFCLSAIGFALLLASVAPSNLAALACVAAALIGFGYGAETDIIPYLVSRYYGFRAFSRLYTYLFVTVPLGGVFGPALAGLLYKRAGESYTPVIFLCLGATLLAAGLISRLGAYPSAEATDDSQPQTRDDAPAAAAVGSVRASPLRP